MFKRNRSDDPLSRLNRAIWVMRLRRGLRGLCIFMALVALFGGIFIALAGIPTQISYKTARVTNIATQMEKGVPVQQTRVNLDGVIAVVRTKSAFVQPMVGETICISETISWPFNRMARQMVVPSFCR